MEDEDNSRRWFFKVVLSSAVLAPLMLKYNKSYAAHVCPKVAPAGKPIASPTEGLGKTLQYVTDAKTTKNPKYKKGDTCITCKFYNAIKAEGGYAPCTMLGMKYVTSCGWCTAFAVKPK